MFVHAFFLSYTWSLPSTRMQRLAQNTNFTYVFERPLYVRFTDAESCNSLYHKLIYHNVRYPRYQKKQFLSPLISHPGNGWWRIRGNDLHQLLNAFSDDNSIARLTKYYISDC